MGLRQRKKKAKEVSSSHSSSQSKDIQMSNSSNRKRSGDPVSGSKRWLWLGLGAVIVLVVVIMYGKDSSLVASFASAMDQRSLQEKDESSTSPSDSPSDTPSDAPSASPVVAEEPVLVKVGSYELLETVPHDPKAFTQGLQLVGDTLYESTGLYGESEVRVVQIATGEVLDRHVLEDQYFGEGISYYTDADGRGRLILLTWKEQTGFVLDATTLEELQRFDYTTSNTEGWGITYRNETNEFLVTDGSHYLHTWNAETRQETRRIPVTILQPGLPEPMTVRYLNELEWDVHRDSLLANVWFQDALLRIDVATGACTNVYNLATLYPNRSPGEDVLNGIALTRLPNEVWVTGKLWPNMYRIRLID